jgi:hypothetical protein
VDDSRLAQPGELQHTKFGGQAMIRESELAQMVRITALITALPNPLAGLASGESASYLSQLHWYATEFFALALLFLGGARLVISDWTALSKQWRRRARQRRRGRDS